MKQLIFCSLVLLVGYTCLAQPQTSIDYPSFYKTCDSIYGFKKVSELNKDLLQRLNDLDKETPYHLFEESILLVEKNQFQEAAIFYHVGLVRQNYYIDANSNYAPNEDWMFAESMKAVLGKKLPLFLHCNPENYLNVLGMAIGYCEKNDYQFSSKLNYPDKYQNAIKILIDLQTDIAKNKEQFKKNWKEERVRLLTKKG